MHQMPIKLTFVQEGTFRITMPKSVSPKELMLQGRQYCNEEPSGFRIEIFVYLPSSALTISSPSHDISLGSSPTATSAVCIQQDGLSQDFNLIIAVSPDFTKPHGWIELFPAFPSNKVIGLVRFS